MYLWDFDGLARQEFTTLSHVGQAALAEFMNAAVMVDPIEYQRHPGEPSDPPRLLRTLPFGPHHEGLVTFLVYPPESTRFITSRQSGSGMSSPRWESQE